MKQMYETGGASLVKGLTHMLEDLANNGGMPSQVDMKSLPGRQGTWPSRQEPSCSRNEVLGA